MLKMTAIDYLETWNDCVVTQEYNLFGPRDLKTPNLNNSLVTPTLFYLFSFQFLMCFDISDLITFQNLIPASAVEWGTNLSLSWEGTGIRLSVEITWQTTKCK